MNQNQLDGITKARLAANIDLAIAGKDLYADDAAYIKKICADAGLIELPESAADSYAAQFSKQSIQDMEVTLDDAVQDSEDLFGGNNQPETPVVTVAGVPTRITMRQARLALLGAGLHASVNAMIAAMPGAQGEAARIEWEFSNEVRSNQPLVQELAPALGLSAAQVDALFVTAAKL